MAILVIVISLYFIVSAICMSIILKDESNITFGLFIFGLLIFPIALIYVTWRDHYIE